MTQKATLKQTSGQHARTVRGGSARPEDACPACGTLMKEAKGSLKLPVNGEQITVPSASHLMCPKCGEVVLRFQEAKRLHEDAIALYRRKHGLSSAGTQSAWRHAPRRPSRPTD
ncbi:MAG TPA: YgiT-type zinc finger protein [Kofleriaceae bacterium]|nr:YgiT-type zinc finger protein [Kofleriaceae bacterium]